MPNQLRVFICHAKEDKNYAREIHKNLHDGGVDAWFDEEDLLVGENWKISIEKAVKSSHIVLVLLSNNSVTKAGYVQKEIKIALDVADEQPEGTIFIIPIKLEECDVPIRLQQFQWLEYYNPKSYDLLWKSLLRRADNIEISIGSNIKTDNFILTPSKENENNLVELYHFPPESGPYALLHKDNFLFVANWHGGNIAILDPINKSIVDTIDLDSYEFFDHSDKSKKEIRRYLPGSSMTIVSNKLFIGQVFSEFILVIDIETKLIVKRIYVEGGGEGAFSASPNGEKVYFASNKVNMLFIIDSTSYEYQKIPYPHDSRGCLTILAHPDDKTVYLGIQRSSSLVVYDTSKKSFVKRIILDNYPKNLDDASIPHRLTLDPDKPLLYIGMFQSETGIILLDSNTYIPKGNISFQPNSSNKYYSWVNPIAQAIYKNYLLVVNTSNHEMCIIDRQTNQQIFCIFLGVANNGPSDIIVIGDIAIIAYPEKNGLIYIDLNKALGLFE